VIELATEHLSKPHILLPASRVTNLRETISSNLAIREKQGYRILVELLDFYGVEISA
jgi:hypothetical protein